MADHGTPKKPLRISEVNFSLLPNSYPGVLLKGDAKTRGLIYGQTFAVQINANVGRHLDRLNWVFCYKLVRDVYMPHIQRYSPRMWREMEGIAVGCRLEVEYIVMLNVRDDLAALLDPPSKLMGESSSVFFSHRKTADNVPILAQSWSESREVYDDDLLVCLEIHYPADEMTPSILMVTEAGMISGCAMNWSGLVVTGNRVYSSSDHQPVMWRLVFPVTCLERRILEHDEMSDTRDVCLFIGRHASRHLLVANREGFSSSLEINTRDCASHHGPLNGNTKVHTNHFVSFEAFLRRNEVWDRYQGRRSQARFCRFEQLIEQTGDKRLSAQDIKGMFSDHHDLDPYSICQHRDDSGGEMTVAFVMFDTNRRVMSVCKGPPCKGTMMHFTFQEPEADGQRTAQSMMSIGARPVNSPSPSPNPKWINLNASDNSTSTGTRISSSTNATSSDSDKTAVRTRAMAPSPDPARGTAAVANLTNLAPNVATAPVPGVMWQFGWAQPSAGSALSLPTLPQVFPIAPMRQPQGPPVGRAPVADMGAGLNGNIDAVALELAKWIEKAKGGAQIPRPSKPNNTPVLSPIREESPELQEGFLTQPCSPDLGAVVAESLKHTEAAETSKAAKTSEFAEMLPMPAESPETAPQSVFPATSLELSATTPIQGSPELSASPAQPCSPDMAWAVAEAFKDLGVSKKSAVSQDPKEVQGTSKVALTLNIAKTGASKTLDASEPMGVDESAGRGEKRKASGPVTGADLPQAQVKRMRTESD